MSGLTFVLSGGAAILVRYGGHPLQPWQTVLVLSLVSALWLVVAVYGPAALSQRSRAVCRGGGLDRWWPEDAQL
jgi:hypothetical protein